MAYLISKALANAIRDYAYAKGEFQKQTGVIASLESAKQRLEDQLCEIEADLVSAQQSKNDAHLKQQEANSRIYKLAPNITEDAIRSIIRTPKIGGLKWGEFKRELIAILLANQGTPVPTSLFMRHFAEKHDVPVETRQQRFSLRQRILRRLEEMVKKGVISSQRSTEGRHEAYWLWIGL